MKRIFLACFLLTATCTATFVQQAAAQTTTVSAADFTAKVNQMDAQIAAGDMAAAQATWTTVHQMMLTELGVTKGKIATAATSADKTTYMAAMTNQRDLYKDIWGLKSDLTTNRSAIHAKLGLFAATI